MANFTMKEMHDVSYTKEVTVPAQSDRARSVARARTAIARNRVPPNRVRNVNRGKLGGDTTVTLGYTVEEDP